MLLRNLRGTKIVFMMMGKLGNDDDVSEIITFVNIAVLVFEDKTRIFPDENIVYNSRLGLKIGKKTG